MSNLLMSEPPLQMLPTLAKHVGIEEALVLQQLHYWLLKSNHVIDGRPWMYNTMQQWQEQFFFMSERSVRRTLTSLKEQGIIEVNNTFNNYAFDRTNWYTINYDRVAGLEQPTAISGPTVRPKVAHDEAKSGASYQENTSNRLLSVDAVLQTGKSRKKAAASRAVNPNSPAILKAYLENLGYEPDAYGREAYAAKKLAERGCTPEDVMYAYNVLKARPYWRDKHLSLSVILKDIGALAHYAKNGGDLTRTGERLSGAQEGEANARSLQEKLIAQGKGYLLE